VDTRLQDFKLIIGTHDLSPSPVAEGDDLTCWMPFPAFRSLFADLEHNTNANGVPLELTSDDGFISDYALLLPWLLETGRTASFFIPTDSIGMPGRVNVPQVREMHRLGMTIGAHGIRHVNWRRLPQAELRKDVVCGIRALEDILGAPVTSAAPPFGGYDYRVLKLLRDHGITEVHTCDGGYAVADGPLRARMAVAQDSHSNLRILELSTRRPGMVDTWRGQWRQVKSSPDLPWRRSGAQRLRAASPSAA
jgi:peptidoglycan/xylan/chitin deacetylase (PgdA/CDA1 family)